MKLKTFATTATTLLGAALISYGQQDSGAQPQPMPGIAPAGQLDAQRAGQQRQADQQSGKQAERQQARQGERQQADQQQADQQQADQQQADQQQADQQQAGQQQAGVEQRSEAEWAQRAQAMRQMNWDGAQASQVQLDELPARARDTLKTVTEGQQLDQELTQFSKDGYDVYRATVSRANEEDLHIFLQKDGTVIETKQKINFSDAPQSAQNAIRQQLGAGAQPQEVYRVIANEETFYVATSGQGDQAKAIRVDNTGNVIQQPGQAQD